MAVLSLNPFFMATAVHEHHHTASDSSGASAGWAMLAIVLLAILIIGGLFYSGFFTNTAGQGGGTDSDINIDLPEEVTPTFDTQTETTN